MSKKNKSLSFWEHLDELRSSFIKILLLTVIIGIIAFFLKEELFGIVLAPKNSDFITYRFFQSITESFFSNSVDNAFNVRLINTGLAEQFLIHMKVAVYAGFLIASPYTIYLLFKFVSPALYTKEKRYTTKLVSSGYLLFITGVLLSYLLIFPLTFRFLGTYQVDVEVENMISLHSYIDTLMMLCVMMGIVFEIPVLCWLFAKFGFLSADFMKKYRRHAIVILLAISAIITPTADIFTLLLVAMPMYLLYETSILIVRCVNRREIALESSIV